MIKEHWFHSTSTTTMTTAMIVVKYLDFWCAIIWLDSKHFFAMRKKTLERWSWKRALTSSHLVHFLCAMILYGCDCCQFWYGQWNNPTCDYICCSPSKWRNTLVLNWSRKKQSIGISTTDSPVKPIHQKFQLISLFVWPKCRLGDLCIVESKTTKPKKNNSPRAYD